MRDFAKSFYLSKTWYNTARAYKQSVGCLCERCRKKGLIVPGEIVHHKIHLTPENINNLDVSLNWDNLELLCRDCHANEHRKYEKRYTIDEWGRVHPT